MQTTVCSPLKSVLPLERRMEDSSLIHDSFDFTFRLSDFSRSKISLIRGRRAGQDEARPIEIRTRTTEGEEPSGGFGDAYETRPHRGDGEKSSYRVNHSSARFIRCRINLRKIDRLVASRSIIIPRLRNKGRPKSLDVNRCDGSLSLDMELIAQRVATSRDGMSDSRYRTPGVIHASSNLRDFQPDTYMRETKDRRYTGSPRDFNTPFRCIR